MSSAPSFIEKVKKFFGFGPQQGGYQKQPEVMNRKLRMEQDLPQQGGYQKEPEVINRKLRMEQDLPQQGGYQRRPAVQATKSGFTNYGAPSVEGMEPNWTKQISSNTVCDWFYIFFIFNAVFVVLLVGTLFSSMKGSTRSRLFQVLPAAIIGAVNVLFWYLMCDRALLQ